MYVDKHCLLVHKLSTYCRIPFRYFAWDDYESVHNNMTCTRPGNTTITTPANTSLIKKTTGDKFSQESARDCRQRISAKLIAEIIQQAELGYSYPPLSVTPWYYHDGPLQGWLG